MARALRVIHDPLLQGYKVCIYNRIDDRTFGELPTGEIIEVLPGGELPITFVLAEDLVPQLLSQLGQPLTDSHLLEALAYERRRVDRVIDKFLS